MKNVFLSGAIASPNSNIATSVGYANNAPSPNTGVPGTQVGADWYNMITSEIQTVVTNAGLTPSATNWAQLAQAIPILTVGGGATAYSNVTSSRTLNSSFVNSNPRALSVAVLGSSTANATLVGEVNGNTLVATYAAASFTVGVNFIVPSGATYLVKFQSGSGTVLTSWQEL